MRQNQGAKQTLALKSKTNYFYVNFHVKFLTFKTTKSVIYGNHFAFSSGRFVLNISAACPDKGTICFTPTALEFKPYSILYSKPYYILSLKNTPKTHEERF